MKLSLENSFLNIRNVLIKKDLLFFLEQYEEDFLKELKKQNW